MDLPKEIRLRILEFTDLNAPDAYSLTFLDGCGGYCRKSGYPPRYAGHCIPNLPTALFYTCHQLSIEARGTYLSQNLLVLGGHPEKTLELYLKRQQPYLLNKIRHVKLYAHGFYYEISSYIAGWAALVDFIFQNFDVAKLDLRIEMGLFCDYSTEEVACVHSVEGLASVPDSLDVITKPLSKLKALKGFCFMWPRYYD